MKKLLVLLLFCSALGAWGQGRAEQIRARIVRPDGQVAAAVHRGAWREEPENSKEAVLAAVELGGDVVEIDAARTSDGVYVLMHDRTLDRTTTGRGPVADRTFAELQALSLRSGCGGVTNRRIPELFDVLAAVRGRALVNIDKAEAYFDELLPLLSQRGLLGTVVLKGKASPQEVRRKFGRYLDSVLYMPIVDLNAPNALQTIERYEAQLNPAAYELVFAERTAAVDAAAKRLKNKTLWYNTLWATLAGGLDDDAAKDRGPDAVYGELIRSLGATILQTDRPTLLVEYLRTKQLHE